MDKHTILTFPLLPLEKRVLDELLKIVTEYKTRHFDLIVGGNPYLQLHRDNVWEEWSIQDNEARAQMETVLRGLADVEFVSFSSDEKRRTLSFTVLPSAILRAQHSQHRLPKRAIAYIMALPLGHWAFVISLGLAAIEIWRFAQTLMNGVP